MEKNENVLNDIKSSEDNENSQFLSKSNDMIELQINKKSIQEIKKKDFKGDLNKIIEELGYNGNNIILLILYFIYFVLHGFSVYYFSCISSAFQSYYKISNGILSLVSSSLFIGNLPGSIFISVASEKIDRKKLLMISAYLLLIFNLIGSLVHNLVVFVLTRFVIGFIIGYYQVYIMNIVLEYLPTKFRSFWLNSLWCGWGIGPIIFLFFCFFFCPDLSYNENETKKPQDFYTAYLFTNIIMLVHLLLSIFFLEDSPRNLLLNNRKEEAGKILKRLIGRDLTEEELESMRDNIANNSENKHGKNKSGFKLIFSKRYFLMNILFIFIYLLKGIVLFGINIAFPIMLHTESEKSSIIKLIIFYGLDLISHITSGFISEINLSNKKYLLIITLLNSVIFSIISIFYLKSLYVLMNVSIISFNIGLNLIMLWSMEMLPTIFRDFGMGVNISFLTIGSVISQYIFIPIAKKSTILTLIVYSVFLLLLISLIIFLPKNKVKELDTELELEENDSNEEDKNK